MSVGWAILRQGHRLVLMGASAPCPLPPVSRVRSTNQGWEAGTLMEGPGPWAGARAPRV